MEKKWLAINFTMPKEPSRVRVSIWRKLKRTGSVNIGQSIWVLPDSEVHLSLFKEIAEEVSENSGQAFIMKTEFIQGPADKSIEDYFNSARNEEYKELLDKCEDLKKEIEKETGRNNFSFAEVEENEREVEKLNTWYDGIIKRDFFSSDLREQAKAELLRCKEILEHYCNEVYVRNGAL